MERLLSLMNEAEEGGCAEVWSMRGRLRMVSLQLVIHTCQRIQEFQCRRSELRSSSFRPKESSKISELHITRTQFVPSAPANTSSLMHAEISGDTLRSRSAIYDWVLSRDRFRRDKRGPSEGI